MTHQEVFDTVARHLLTQGHRAIGNNGRCKYYNPETGDKCAIGCLIPAELYDSSIEDAAIDDCWRDETCDTGGHLTDILEQCGLTEKHRMLLGKLQSVHDNCEDFADSTYGIRSQLRQVAEAHCLSPAVLEESYT